MTDFRMSDTYRKDTHHAPGHGYGRNIGTDEHPKWVAERSLRPYTVIVHTTSNPEKGTKIWNECSFIRDSPLVSCHEVIGKDGSVYIILPANMVAWHAGDALPTFLNGRSYGYELHCSVGEQPTWLQMESLGQRVRQRIKDFDLQPAEIETHRAVALPKGRKSDPEGWTDAQFYAWRDALFVIDYAVEWGTAYPYFAVSSIAGAWRDTYRTGQGLGAAVSDEFMTSVGVIRAFVRGYIVYTAAAGVKVHLW